MLYKFADIRGESYEIEDEDIMYVVPNRIKRIIALLERVKGKYFKMQAWLVTDASEYDDEGNDIPPAELLFTPKGHHRCGTSACIAGWAATLADHADYDYIGSDSFSRYTGLGTELADAICTDATMYGQRHMDSLERVKVKDVLPVLQRVLKASLAYKRRVARGKAAAQRKARKAS